MISQPAVILSNPSNCNKLDFSSSFDTCCLSDWWWLVIDRRLNQGKREASDNKDLTNVHWDRPSRTKLSSVRLGNMCLNWTQLTSWLSAIVSDFNFGNWQCWMSWSEGKVGMSNVWRVCWDWIRKHGLTLMKACLCSHVESCIDNCVSWVFKHERVEYNCVCCWNGKDNWIISKLIVDFLRILNTSVVNCLQSLLKEMSLWWWICCCWLIECVRWLNCLSFVCISFIDLFVFQLNLKDNKLL